MANGYNGKILRVNLTSGAITTEKLEEMFCRRYIGGAGFITYYLMKELAPGIDALGIANKLMFMMGPMTGLTLSGSGRNCSRAASPKRRSADSGERKSGAPGSMVSSSRGNQRNRSTSGLKTVKSS
jgi:aldehyde:ferredoxin oxidoreductase